MSSCQQTPVASPVPSSRILTGSVRMAGNPEIQSPILMLPRTTSATVCRPAMRGNDGRTGQSKGQVSSSCDCHAPSHVNGPSASASPQDRRRPPSRPDRGHSEPRAVPQPATPSSKPTLRSVDQPANPTNKTLKRSEPTLDRFCRCGSTGRGYQMVLTPADCAIARRRRSLVTSATRSAAALARMSRSAGSPWPSG